MITTFISSVYNPIQTYRAITGSFISFPILSSKVSNSISLNNKTPQISPFDPMGSFTSFPGLSDSDFVEAG
jgi:hypothetical protein